jgi:RNA polymerase sigma factor (sigma-70 family)
MVNPVVPLAVSSAAGDEPAANARFETLLRQYGSFLRRTIMRVCPRELGVSVDDIEQEAMVSLWKALKNETDIRFPAAYVHRVGVSAALRAIRRARTRREESLDSERDDTPALANTLPAPAETSPHKAAERREHRHTIQVALAGLAEKRRVAVALHLKGLTTQEIGQLLGWSEPKARNLVHRGLKDLRAALRAVGVEYSR